MASSQVAGQQPIPGVSYADAASLDPPEQTNGTSQVTTQQPIPGISYADAASMDPPAQTNGTGQVTTPGEYVGEGLDAAPKSPVRGHKKVTARGSRGSLRQTSKDQKSNDGGEVVYEKVSGMNGSDLTSIKPSYDYEESIRLDDSERRVPRNNGLKLVSGRQPAAGWETSG
jgi:2-acylglycerol O-acyltransferase 2